jgi:hypothetical protein
VKRQQIQLLLGLLLVAGIGYWLIGVNKLHLSDQDYWTAWAAGKISGVPSDSRLQKGFEQFFRKGKLTSEQKELLQHAHHAVESKPGVVLYSWTDKSRALPGSGGEGTRYYVIIR